MLSSLQHSIANPEQNLYGTGFKMAIDNCTSQKNKHYTIFLSWTNFQKTE
jgi:hypothetical protein